jgi:hypothetical protein
MTDPTELGPDVTDEQLLHVLARALGESEPIPERVLEGARAAVTWRTIDAELADLAELVFDSARDEAGVRSEDINRQMTFQAPGVEIEVMVIDNGARRLIGQLVPGAEMMVQLTAGEVVQEVQTDDLGRFSFDDVAPGPVRLVVSTDGRPVVRTEWMLL